MCVMCIAVCCACVYPMSQALSALFPAGVVYIMVLGRIQLRYSQEDQRTESEHRWPRLHGSSLCRQGLCVVSLSFYLSHIVFPSDLQLHSFLCNRCITCQLLYFIVNLICYHKRLNYLVIYCDGTIIIIR